MLKKILKNRKALLVLCVAAIAVSAGITYAWFTSQVSKEVGTLNQGRLKIGGEFTIDDTDYYYEPGVSQKITGTVTNDGTLPFVAKVNLKSLVTITSDGDGEPLDESEYYQLADVEGINIELDTSILGYKDGPDGEMVAWLQDENGEYYLFIDGKIDADVAFNVSFSEDLDNYYQGAKVTLSTDWLATQVADGATLKAFGVIYNDLELVQKDLNNPLGRSLATYNKINARLNELFNR